jgi:hypothetical protein
MRCDTIQDWALHVQQRSACNSVKHKRTSPPNGPVARCVVLRASSESNVSIVIVVTTQDSKLCLYSCPGLEASGIALRLELDVRSHLSSAVAKACSSLASLVMVGDLLAGSMWAVNGWQVLCGKATCR